MAFFVNAPIRCTTLSIRPPLFKDSHEGDEEHKKEDDPRVRGLNRLVKLEDNANAPVDIGELCELQGKGRWEEGDRRV